MQTARIGDYMVWYENAEEYRILRREIFTEHCYYMEIEGRVEKILDLGGNIGLATLYLKKLYPEARVTVVEPFAENLKLLKKNVEENQLARVEIVEGAVVGRGGEVELYADKSEGGWYSMVGIKRGGWTGKQESKKLKVISIKLGELVGEGVDLVKIDIEGAEEAVLAAEEGVLKRVGNIMLEYHPISRGGEERILEILNRRGYQVEVKEDPDKLGQGLKMIYGYGRS